jgi:hypothetical protein
MKFTKPFRYVRDGEIYPVSFNEGDECPPDLIDAARAHDALETSEVPKVKRRVATDA